MEMKQEIAMSIFQILLLLQSPVAWDGGPSFNYAISSTSLRAVGPFFFRS